MKNKFDLDSFTDEFNKLMEISNTVENSNIKETEKIKLKNFTDEFSQLLEKQKTVKEEQKKESVKNIKEPGWISKSLASIIAFFAGGYIKGLHQSLQSPALIKATDDLKKSVAEYNKNFIDNPEVQAELKKLGVKFPDFKDVIK